MEGTGHRGGRRQAAAAPVRRPPRAAGTGRAVDRLTWAGSYVWQSVSSAFLLASLVLGVVCLLVPKILGAVPLAILSGSMAPTMPAGALAVVRPVDVTHVRIGDVLTYQAEPDDPTLVTHRVIAVSRDADGGVSLILKGDANDAPDDRPVRPEQVQGSVVYAVPYFGRLANRLNVGAGATYTHWAGCALIVVGALRVLLGLCRSRRRRRQRAMDQARRLEALRRSFD